MTSTPSNSRARRRTINDTTVFASESMQSADQLLADRTCSDTK